LQNDQIKYKKYFYALRPLLACKYIEEHHCPPPVLFDQLLEIVLPTDLRTGINDLLEKKKVTDEKDLNPQIPVIYDFISSELNRQKEFVDALTDDHNKNWEMLNQIFIEILKGR